MKTELHALSHSMNLERLMNRCHILLSSSVAALLFCVAVAPLSALDNDWPTFRGPDRSGVSPETGLLDHWPDSGPELVWETKGAGRGYASVAISGGRFYTLGDGPSTAGDADEYLTCFDQATGKQIWRTKTGPAWNKGRPDWQGSRSTPTVDGDRVYVISPHGKLVCVNTDGAEQWQIDLKSKFSGKKADNWGYSESVLIDGDNLICTPGGPQNTMVALNKKTGKKIWSSSRPNDRGAGHASVVISEVGSTRVYVQTTGSGAMGVRASDGKFLWSYDIDRTTAVIPTPIVRDDLVFMSVGYKRGGALLRQYTESGRVGVKEVYSLKTTLSNKHGGVVLIGDYLYGDSDAKGIPFCADLMTGEIMWQSRGSGKGSAAVVGADGHLYFRYDNGIMTLVNADPGSFQEISKFKIPGSGSRPSWSHPVILDGKLYLREGDKILCYNISS